MRQGALLMPAPAAVPEGAGARVDDAPAQPDSTQTREETGGTSTEAPSSASEATFTPPEMHSANEAPVDVVAAAVEVLERSDEPTPPLVELAAGALLASGPAEHPCRYAGTVLLCAAAAVLGFKMVAAPVLSSGMTLT